MAKIPKDTPWTRFKTFLKGILLYNTIYWGRASDGLRPPRPTRAERRANRPQRDLSIIKPREKPRAKLGAEEEDALPAHHTPAHGGTVLPPAPRAVSQEYRLPDPAVRAPRETPGGGGELVRRKKRRRRSSHGANVSPMDAFAVDGSGGLLRRIFGRKSS